MSPIISSCFLLIFVQAGVERDMTLLERCAILAHQGTPRDDIASELMVSRQMVDWLMDSDSFAVILQRVSGNDIVCGDMGST
jgi:orotate phosphoribosyltransferase-like protein